MGWIWYLHLTERTAFRRKSGGSLEQPKEAIQSCYGSSELGDNQTANSFLDGRRADVRTSERTSPPRYQDLIQANMLGDQITHKRYRLARILEGKESIYPKRFEKTRFYRRSKRTRVDNCYWWWTRWFLFSEIESCLLRRCSRISPDGAPCEAD
jgi:hypothetical protein